MQYYYLVAGLPEVPFDTGNAKIDAPGLRDQIKAELSKADQRAVELLYMYYDIQNIIGYIHGSRLPFNRLGNLNERQVERLVEGHEEDDEQIADAETLLMVSALPLSVTDVIDRFKGRNPLEREDFEPVDADQLEQELLTAFYAACDRSGCDFLVHWSDTDRTIRNITAAYKARAMKLDASRMIVDRGELYDQLMNSQAADFGLKGEFPYMEQLMAVLETADFVERERRMDQLRWEITDRLSEHDYFGIAFLMSYLIHLNILYRWTALDKEEGERSFRRMVAALTDPEKVKPQ